MTKYDTVFQTELDNLARQNLLWRLRQLQGPSVPRARVNGKDVLILCSNNYLGLSTHPKLKERAIEAIRNYGVGSGSVRIIAGNMDLHDRLDTKIAEFKGTEAAVHFQTGFATNAGSIPQLAGDGDLIISDELNHGSIIDGVRLSRAEKAVYKHCDMADLRRVLEESSKKGYKKSLILTDGVFSMDGDIAPLPDVAKLAEEFGTMTYVDDAHGDGVLGRNGRGIVDHFHLHGKVDLEMGTFSKAFGVVGGHVAGSSTVISFLINKARTFLLSSSQPPPVAAACIAALEVVDEEPGIVKRLWENTHYFKKGLKDLGFDIGRSETPITPVMLGESGLAQRFSQELINRGVLALPIVFPMVARDKARIRTMVNAELTREDLDFALKVFADVGHDLKVIQ